MMRYKDIVSMVGAMTGLSLSRVEVSFGFYFTLLRVILLYTCKQV